MASRSMTRFLGVYFPGQLGPPVTVTWVPTVASLRGRGLESSENWGSEGGCT